MTDQELNQLMARFRRDMRLAGFVRWALLGLLFGCAAAAGVFNQAPYRQVAWFTVLTILVGWALLTWLSFRQARLANAGGALLAIGDVTEAEARLSAAMMGFSLFRNVKLMTGHHFAAILHARGQFRQGSLVCRELLRHRFGSLRSVWTTSRLLWADCLLMLGDFQEAYEAYRPVCDVELTLRDQLKLLPIEVHYGLAAGQEDRAVENLGRKVRLAEMTGSATAGLIHAMLAEACRRRGLTEQWKYLARRAWLYADLDQLLTRCPLIEPVAAAREYVRFRRAEP